MNRAPAAELDWPDVDERVGRSTVLIRIFSREVNVGLGRSSQEGKRAEDNYLEDRSCNVCGGHGNAACPVRGCVKGRIARRERVAVSVNPFTKQPVYGFKTFYEPCSRCGGGNAVRCPACGGRGRDPDLR